MKPKKIFNTESTEKLEDAKVINGNPNGMISLVKTPHQWAVEHYKRMKKRTWFTGQIDITKDKVNYHRLSDDSKRTYDLVLSQLITNDSLQVNQLMDNINCYITSPVVNLCLAVQSMEEGLHTESYSNMAEDIAKDTEYIFSLPQHDEELMRKNKSVEAMYEGIYSGEVPTSKDILMACGGNQILEELVFPGGFVAILLMTHEMPGSANYIREINVHSFPTAKAVA